MYLFDSRVMRHSDRVLLELRSIGLASNSNWPPPPPPMNQSGAPTASGFQLSFDFMFESIESNVCALAALSWCASSTVALASQYLAAAREDDEVCLSHCFEFNVLYFHICCSDLC
jgi:hypothetical protein